MADRVRRDGRRRTPNLIWLWQSGAEVALGLAEQSFENAAEAGVLELPFAAREEDRLVVAELFQLRPGSCGYLRPFSCDIPLELLAGVGRAPDRLTQRVVALVAYEGSHVNADLRVV